MQKRKQERFFKDSINYIRREETRREKRDYRLSLYQN